MGMLDRWRAGLALLLAVAAGTLPASPPAVPSPSAQADRSGEPAWVAALEPRLREIDESLGTAGIGVSQ